MIVNYKERNTFLLIFRMVEIQYDDKMWLRGDYKKKNSNF